MTKTTKSSEKEAKKAYDSLTIKKLEKSKVEITGTIPADHFETFRKKALENINNEVKIDGFRKGKIPEATLVSKVGEMMILEEMAELALSRAYPEIVITEKIDAIGRPEIQITKIAKNNPLEFKIITAVVPDIKLADYRKIKEEAAKEKTVVDEVTDKELDDTILRIRRSRANHEGHDHEKMTPEEHDKAVDATLPEFNDMFVQTLGDFKDIADFKEKVKLSLFEEKKSREKDKKRVSISDKLIDGTTVEIPEILIDSELKRIESQFSDDIARMGVNLDDYMKHAKKSIEDLRKDWMPHAEKKAKLQLILNRIATEEKIMVSPEEIENEVNHIVEHYKDADRERAAIYAETVLMNEKIFNFLEETK